MATATSASSAHPEPEVESLRCSVCLDEYKDPKVLPCCHTFCKSCLDKLSDSGIVTSGAEVEGQDHQAGNEDEPKTTMLTCPQCRAQHELPGGVDNLLTNFAIKDELQKRRKPSHKLGDVMLSKMHCGLCESTDPLVSYCTNCFSPLCDFCHKAHQRQKTYYGHSVKMISEIDLTLLTETSPKYKGQMFCLEHPNQIPQIFCNSCDELVCSDCIVDGHEGHRFARINSETRTEMETKLSDASSTVHNTLEVLQNDFEYVKCVEKVTNDMGTRLKADIEKMFDSFIVALQRRRDDLLAKSEEHCTTKLKVLWSEKDHLENKIAKLNTTLRFSERIRLCSDAGEFLALSSQALRNLKELRDCSWESETVKEIDSRYLILEKKTNEPNVFQTAAKFNESEMHRCYVKWKDFPAQVELGVEYKGVVYITRDRQGKHPFVLYNNPTVSIRHIQSMTCHVADISVHRSSTLPSAWDVRFTPYCGGQHICSLKAEKTDTMLYSLEVTGVPPVGSKVMRGPSWNYSETLHGYGASTSEVAVVRDHNTLQDDKTIAAHWEDGKSFKYRWGADGMYDIQMYHCLQ